MRFFFNSPRYSEDMDLDVLHGNVSTLKKNGYKVLESAALKRSLSSYGIVDLLLNDPEKAKHTETTQRFRLRLVTASGEMLPTKVEFSRRGKVGEDYATEKVETQIAHHYRRISYRVQHYTGPAAILQKIRALAGREITQARDVFDLNTLHSGGFFKSPKLLEKVPKAILNQAKENLERLTFKDYEGQVLEFLVPHERTQYDSEAVWNEMKKTFGQVISNGK